MGKYDTLSLKDIRRELANRGARQSGRKKELIERLESYDRNFNFQIGPGTSGATYKYGMAVPDPKTFKDLTNTASFPKLTKVAVDAYLSTFDASLKAGNRIYDSSVNEFMDFTGKIIVERTRVGQRASVEEQNHMCHVFVRQDQLAGVAIADSEYPSRVSFSMLTKLLDEFTSQYPASTWPSLGPVQFELGKVYLEKYQNPKEADPMTKVQTELDETKVIVYNTIEQVLERGEKLDDLVAKSEGLSTSSRAFYKTAKKTNSCCSW